MQCKCPRNKTLKKNAEMSNLQENIKYDIKYLI